MSKKFKGKTCAYCGKAGASTTGDHVFARGFFLHKRRTGLPEVPACAPCNSTKSKIETYLLQVLPLGANHAEARETCNALMPKRARNSANKVLRDILAGPEEAVRLYDQQGGSSERIPVLVDAEMLSEWYGLVARGLAFYHWRVTTPDYRVETVPLAAETEADILALVHRSHGAKQVENVAGGGAFTYRGFMTPDTVKASIWIIWLYGRMPIGGDPSVSKACAASWAVFITPAKHDPGLSVPTQRRLGRAKQRPNT